MCEFLLREVFPFHSLAVHVPGPMAAPVINYKAAFYASYARLLAVNLPSLN